MAQYQSIVDDVLEQAAKAGRKPEEITVVAVSKSHPPENIEKVYESGCLDFGENRVPEALDKMGALPRDIRWHFIGSLQRKKVPKIIGRFHLIHSVDTPELAEKISSSGAREGIETNILLEVNTSGEPAKHGLSPDEWLARLEEVFSLPNLKISGLMTMAPLTENEYVIRDCFSRLRKFRDRIEKEFSRSLPDLSMGMTNDYPIAIEEGATLLRIGTAIFD